MKILILGAQGNLGQQLNKVFSVEDNVVIAWDRSEIDVTDKGLIAKKINDLRPDVVINAAAYNAVDKCEDDEAEYELAKKLNVDAPSFIAEACLETKSIFVHYSSDYVFAGDKREGYTEDDEPAPINKYGKTKLMGEREVIKHSGAGLKWYVIRTSKLFGPRGDSEFSKPSFFDIMLKLAKEKDELSVVNEEASCFTYTTDLAKATKSMIDNEVSWGIYHIVNSVSCTWFKAVKDLFKMTNIENVKVKPIQSEDLNRAAKRPKYSVLLNTKLPKLRDWRDALKEYLITVKN